MSFVDLSAESTDTTELPVQGRTGSGRPDGGVVARVAALAALAAVVLVVPVAVPRVYINIVSLAAVYGIVALSMNILVGYTGQVSLGHAAFFGIGAFASGYMITESEMPWGMGLAVAGVTGGGAALLLGAVALRVRGLYLAIVTIAYGLFAQFVIFQIRPLTGGGAGMAAPRPALVSGDVAYAYLCIAALAVALAFDWRLTETRAGRAIHALRDDERVAASWAVNVTSYKLLAFVLSGLFAGVAGGLFASIEGVVAPADFEFTLSLTFLLMTVIGGAGNRWGVVQGGILFAILPTVLTVTHANIGVFPFTVLTASTAPALLALLLLLVLVFFPGGFAQLQEPVLRWLSFKPYGRAGAATAALAAAGSPSTEESDGAA